jgi:DNA fragmentation factor alpha subunit
MSGEGHGHGHFRRPFKVWTADRSVRKGLTASNLDDLIRIAKAKLEVDDEVTVVLEDDGTEIDSEQYFQSLNTNTVLLVLKQNERWHPAGVDAIRAGPSSSVDETDRTTGSTTLGLVQKAVGDPNSLLFMSVDELQDLSDVDPSCCPGLSGSAVTEIVEMAGRLYNQRMAVKESLQLMRVIERAMDQPDSGEQSASGDKPP